MCLDCGFCNCPGGCPGIPEARPASRCAECGEDISFMDGVCYECSGKLYHDYCVDQISRERLIHEFEIGRDELLEAAGFREFRIEGDLYD